MNQRGHAGVAPAVSAGRFAPEARRHTQPGSRAGCLRPGARTAPALYRVAVGTSAEAEEAVVELVQRVTGKPAGVCFDLETGRRSVSAYLELRRAAPSPRPAAERQAPTRPTSGHLRRRWGSLRQRLHAGFKWIADCGLVPGPATVSIRKVARRDWAESWKRHFKPIEFGQALLLKPSWSRRRARDGQATVVLDPGLSFGTGQHPTTRFCIEQLVAWRRAAARQGMLDVGTGSGVLAIAAAKLGYGPVRALDFDPACVRVARHNAQANAVRIRIVRGDVRRLPPRPGVRFGVVCANLTADLLASECARLVAQISPGGVLVLAGILASEFVRIRGRYRALGWRLVASARGGEWRSGAFRGQGFGRNPAGVDLARLT